MSSVTIWLLLLFFSMPNTCTFSMFARIRIHNTAAYGPDLDLDLDLSQKCLVPKHYSTGTCTMDSLMTYTYTIYRYAIVVPSPPPPPPPPPLGSWWLGDCARLGLSDDDIARIWETKISVTTPHLNTEELASEQSGVIQKTVWCFGDLVFAYISIFLSVSHYFTRDDFEKIV